MSRSQAPGSDERASRAPAARRPGAGRPAPETRPDYPWWLGLVCRIGIGILDLLMLTWRVRLGAGQEHLEALLASDRPVVLAFWHNRLVICGEFIQRRVIHGGRRPVALLTSFSRDGEIAARMAGMRGYRIIRGSTSRGGLGSLRKMHRAMRREGYSCATAPDGPRGPACEAQPGTVLLAKLAGAPIVPVAYAASRCWRLRSWDRLVVPKPSARAVVTIGAPMEVAPDLPGEELEAVAADLERRLNDLVARAEEMVEVGDEPKQAR